MSETTYASLHRDAAWFDRDARGLLAVGGPDRADYLQGQLTNDVGSLADGRGCYTAYLTPQGRVVADAEVLRAANHLLLDVHATVAASLVSRFQELVFTEDVQIEDWSEAWRSFGMAGARAAARLGAGLRASGVDLDEGMLESLAEHQVVHRDAPGGRVVVARTDALGVRQYDVWAQNAVAPAVRAALVETGCPEADAETLQTIRVERGRPVFPDDLDGVIPLEAGIESRAISFTKGCYVGQEVIVRVVQRGHGRVARRLVGLRIDASGLEGMAPAPGSSLRRDAREVGRVTSVVRSPALGQVIGLAYVMRDLAEPDTRLVVDTIAGHREATVAPLPFVS